MLPPDVTPAEAGPGVGWRWSSYVAATSSPSPYAGVCALRQGRTSGGGRKRWPSLLPSAPAVTPKEYFQVARWLGGPTGPSWCPDFWAGKVVWERPEAGSGRGCGSNSVDNWPRRQGQGFYSGKVRSASHRELICPTHPGEVRSSLPRD